jgi:hypothetical protein
MHGAEDGKRVRKTQGIPWKNPATIHPSRAFPAPPAEFLHYDQRPVFAVSGFSDP